MRKSEAFCHLLRELFQPQGNDGYDKARLLITLVYAVTRGLGGMAADPPRKKKERKKKGHEAVGEQLLLPVLGASCCQLMLHCV